MLVVVVTDRIGSYKSNYHTIMTKTAPLFILVLYSFCNNLDIVYQIGKSFLSKLQERLLSQWTSCLVSDMLISHKTIFVDFGGKLRNIVAPTIG